MTSCLPTCCLLSVEAEPDATVPARILHLLTVRGDIPEAFSVRRAGNEGLRIAIELSGHDHGAAESVRQKILKLPTVIEVSTAWLHRRAP